MSKFILSLITALAIFLTAIKTEAKEATASFATASKFSCAIQNYSGLNQLTSLIASKAFTYALERKLSGKVKVKVSLFSFTDLLNGKIKTVQVNLANSSFKGITLSSLVAKTETPIWIRLSNKHGQSRGLSTPSLIHIDGVISENDISNALENPKIAANLRSFRLSLPGLGEQNFQFIKPKVTLQNNCIKVSSTLAAGGIADQGVQVELEGRLELLGSKIFIRDLKMNSPDISNCSQFADFASNFMNPLIDLSKFDRQTRAFRLDKLTFAGDKMQFSGNLVLAPAPSFKQEVVTK